MKKEESSLLDILFETGNYELLNEYQDITKNSDCLNQEKDRLLSKYKIYFPLYMKDINKSIIIYLDIKYNRNSYGNIVKIKNKKFIQSFYKLLNEALLCFVGNNSNLVPYVDWRNFNIELPLIDYIMDNMEGNSYEAALFICIVSSLAKNRVERNIMFSGIYNAKTRKFEKPGKVESKIEACQREYKDKIAIIIPEEQPISIDNLIHQAFGNDKLVLKFPYSIEESYCRIRENDNEQYLGDMRILYRYLKDKSYTKEKNLFVKVGYIIAEYYNLNGKLKESLKCYKMLFKEYKKLEDSKELKFDDEISDIMNSYGVLLSDLYLYEKSEDILKKNLQDKKKHLTIERQARTMGSLGQLYSFWGKLKKGEECFYEVVNIMKKCDRRELLRDYTYLSYNYILQKRYDEANDILLNNVLKNVSILDNTKSEQKQRCYCFDNLILSYFLSKKYKKAMNLYEDSTNRHNICSGFTYAHILQYIGYSYIMEGNMDKGIKCIGKAFKIYDELESPDTDLQVISICLFCMKNNIKLNNISDFTKEIGKRIDKELFPDVYNKYRNCKNDFKSLEGIFKFIRI